MLYIFTEALNDRCTAYTTKIFSVVRISGHSRSPFTDTVHMTEGLH
jgi:hypothetical protein